MKQIFIAWARFQRRQISMESYFGFKCVFIQRDFGKKWLKPFEYFAKGWKTLRICVREKPDTVWVSMPPVPALTFIFIYRLFFNRNLRVVADCHNAMFRPPWSKVPFAIWHLNRCDLIVVHNDTLLDTARSLGIMRQVQVLEDAPAILQGSEVAPASDNRRKKILFPASFNQDEPIGEVLRAARLAPELDFVITGNPARTKRVHDLDDVPRNVRLTGFLSRSEFEKQFTEADAILGLTNLEGVQLSVCSEAVGAGKPMVLSGTALLKRLFPKGAVYVDWTEPKSIAQGCLLAIAEKRRLEHEVITLREERLQRWTKSQALAIREWLQRPVTAIRTQTHPSPARFRHTAD